MEEEATGVLAVENEAPERTGAASGQQEHEVRRDSGRSLSCRLEECTARGTRKIRAVSSEVEAAGTVEGDAEGPDIALLVVLPLPDLRRHVVRLRRRQGELRRPTVPHFFRMILFSSTVAQPKSIIFSPKSVSC